jgi:hypothetical protein
MAQHCSPCRLRCCCKCCVRRSAYSQPSAAAGCWRCVCPAAAADSEGCRHLLAPLLLAPVLLAVLSAAIATACCRFVFLGRQSSGAAAPRTGQLVHTASGLLGCVSRKLESSESRAHTASCPLTAVWLAIQPWPPAAWCQFAADGTGPAPAAASLLTLLAPATTSAVRLVTGGIEPILLKTLCMR